jgi:chemotaxis protein MotB
MDEQLIVVRRHGLWVEVEIRTDILAPSGVATLSNDAVNVLSQLAETLKPFPNPISRRRPHGQSTEAVSG